MYCLTFYCLENIDKRKISISGTFCEESPPTYRELRLLGLPLSGTDFDGRLRVPLNGSILYSLFHANAYSDRMPLFLPKLTINNDIIKRERTM